jgi:tetratricopeptide (TPR) repeat protein
MGFRFFKRLNILPGVQLNLSKSGGSVSIGPQGAKLTLGSSGGRVTFGMPGTGLFYTTNFSLGKLGKLFGQSSGPTESEEFPPASPPEETISSTPHEQNDFTAGCQALSNGDEENALIHLQNATHLADGAFLAGVLALKKGRLSEAISYLSVAAAREHELGQHLSQHGIAATLSLEITEELAAHVGPNMRGVLLALTEAHQAQNQKAEAVACLERLRQMEPSDIVVNLSLAELLMDDEAPTKEVCQRVVQLTEGVENDSAVHTALLLYKAKGLRRLGLLEAAQEILTGALKKKKDRSVDLLRVVRYERALVYEGQGENRKARTELEKLYAEAPEHEDVKARLGL